MSTILIVDDDPDNRRLLGIILRHAGYVVTEAEDGARALELIAEGAPDLAIVDLHMPRMGGTTFVKEVRASGISVTLALYTATRPDAALSQFMEAYEIAGLIPKPSEPADVIASVAAILSRTSSARIRGPS